MERNLNLLVDSLQKEEVRHLKLFIQKYESDAEERKDLALFDLIRKGNDYDDDYVHSILYPEEKNKNSFYRLRNRLMDEINKSLLTLHYNESDINSVLYNIILSRLFQQRNNYRMAQFYLRKAERKAMELNSAELLDLIYRDYIKISTESLEIDPEIYIQKRKENRILLNQLNEIDDVLAVLIYRIRVSQNFNMKNYDIVNVLSSTLKQYANKELTRNNPELKIKIYQAVSRILVQQHDYAALEKYLKITFKEFNEDKLFNRNNHEIKLQMLTYLANSLFKNGKFEESLEAGDKLKNGLNEFDGLLKERYLFYYYNSQVNNYSVLDRHKAIAVLQEAVQDKMLHKNKFNTMFLNLQMALQYFDLKEFKASLKSLVKLKLEENFKVFDTALQLKILVFELMVRYELEDFDFIETQVQKVKREYKEMLRDENFDRQKRMLDFLGKIIYSDNDRTSLKKKINALFDIENETMTADMDLVNYNSWVRELLKNR